MTTEFLADTALGLSFLAVVAFVLVNIRPVSWKRPLGWTTMIDSLTLLAVLAWLNVYPWTGFDVREHQGLRLGFWIVVLAVLITRVVRFIRSQKKLTVEEGN